MSGFLLLMVQKSGENSPVDMENLASFTEFYTSQVVCRTSFINSIIMESWYGFIQPKISLPNSEKSLFCLLLLFFLGDSNYSTFFFARVVVTSSSSQNQPIRLEFPAFFCPGLVAALHPPGTVASTNALSIYKNAWHGTGTSEAQKDVLYLALLGVQGPHPKNSMAWYVPGVL